MTKERKKPEAKLDYEITDIEALQAALPQLVTEEIITRTLVINGEKQTPTEEHRKFVGGEEKKKLYQLVKINHGIGLPTPGITVANGEEKPAETAPAAETNDSVEV